MTTKKKPEGETFLALTLRCQKELRKAGKPCGVAAGQTEATRRLRDGETSPEPDAAKPAPKFDLDRMCANCNGSTSSAPIDAPFKCAKCCSPTAMRDRAEVAAAKTPAEIGRIACRVLGAVGIEVVS